MHCTLSTKPGQGSATAATVEVLVLVDVFVLVDVLVLVLVVVIVDVLLMHVSHVTGHLLDTVRKSQNPSNVAQSCDSSTPLHARRGVVVDVLVEEDVDEVVVLTPPPPHSPHK